MNDWRSILVLILSGICVIGFIALGIALYVAKKKRFEAEADVERYKGRWMEAVDQVRRLKALRDNAELTDDEAFEKLVDGIDSWNALDPSGSGETTDSS